MHQDDENDVFTVPTQELTEFANILFNRLYNALDLTQQTIKTKNPYRKEIGWAVLRIKREVNGFNNEFINRCCFEVDRSTLVQKICASYPGYDHFKKLYYTTVFILDIILWWHSFNEAADLSEGPRLWIEVFRNNFDSVFEDAGGWHGFHQVGIRLLELENRLPPFMPDFFRAVMLGLRALIPTWDESREINIDGILDGIKRLRLRNILKAVSPKKAKAQTEETPGNPPQQVAENPNLPAAVEGHLGLRDRFKRRHEAGPSNSDTENDSLSPSKPKFERTAEDSEKSKTKEAVETPNISTAGVADYSGGIVQRKRRHDVGPSDSDIEMDAPSPSTSKLDRTTTE